jgi:hypothetical protein
MTDLPGFGDAGDIGQIALAVALADVKRQCLMLADDLRIVGEQMWPRCARESIQNFNARPFDKVPYLQAARAGRTRSISWVGINFTTGLLENGVKSPSSGLQRTDVRARMRVATVSSSCFVVRMTVAFVRGNQQRITG